MIKFLLYPTLGITDQIFDGYINFRVCTRLNEQHSFAPWDNTWYPTCISYNNDLYNKCKHFGSSHEGSDKHNLSITARHTEPSSLTIKTATLLCKAHVLEWSGHNSWVVFGEGLTEACCQHGAAAVPSRHIADRLLRCAAHGCTICTSAPGASRFTIRQIRVKWPCFPFLVHFCWSKFGPNGGQVITVGHYLW